MTVRQSISKSLRFAVLRRDGFTCQYCGARPPTVELVIDHVTPVSSGGTNEPGNLLTACEPCNQGKRDTSIDLAPDPKAPQLYYWYCRCGKQLPPYGLDLIRDMWECICGMRVHGTRRKAAYGWERDASIVHCLACHANMTSETAERRPVRSFR